MEIAYPSAVNDLLEHILQALTLQGCGTE